jgi:hypothetical protein
MLGVDDKAGSMAPAHGPSRLAMPDSVGARRPRIYFAVRDVG